jgi:hypothetical protein
LNQPTLNNILEVKLYKTMLFFEKTLNKML